MYVLLNITIHIKYKMWITVNDIFIITAIIKHYSQLSIYSDKILSFNFTPHIFTSQNPACLCIEFLDSDLLAF